MSDTSNANKGMGSAIAEALRAKRERKSDPSLDLAALEASLLADIESFDQRAFTPPSEPTAPAKRPIMERDLGLPTINANVMPTRSPAVPTPPPSVTAPAETRTTPQGNMGLLAQLRQQAENQVQESERKTRQEDMASQRIDEGLRTAFNFFHELVEQLNIIRPTIQRNYALTGIVEFSGLVWQKGFVDYRTRPQSAGSVYDSVSLSFQLKATRPVVLERDGLAVDSLRKMLSDNGVVFTCEEKLNQRRMLEKAVFSIAPEVKTTIRWQASPETGCIVLDTRNLERFGDIRYFIPPEKLHQASLEEFGRLILGEPNAFREFTRR